MLLLNNGSSMKFPRPSRTTTGNHIHLISNQMEIQTMLDALQQIQDGGNYSNMKIISLKTRKEKSWKSKVMLMLKTETSLCINLMEELTKCGMLYMLMNGRENLVKENSTKTSDSMLKEISMFNQHFLTIDT